MGAKRYKFEIAKYNLLKYVISDNEISDCAELEKLINDIGFNFVDSNEDYSYFKIHINKLIEKLYTLSKEQNYYWQLCSFKTWQKTIDKRSIAFMNKYKDTGANLYSLDYEEPNRLTKQVDPATKELIYLCEKDGIEKKLYFKTEKIDIYNEITHSFNRICKEVQSRIELLSKPVSFTKSNEKNDIWTTQMAKKYIEKYTIDYFKKFVSEQKETILESTFISNEIDMYDIQINKAKQEFDGNKVKYFEHCKVIASEYLKEFIAPEPIVKVETKESPIIDFSTSTINGLDEINFSNYLKEKKYCIIEVKKLINENKNSLPFIIALLKKMGFITYLLDNQFKTKELLFNRLSKILSCNTRRIKGNVNVLSANSNEDKVNYTSWQYIENINLQSLGL